MRLMLPQPPRRLFVAKEERKMATQHWAWQLTSHCWSVAENSTRQSIKCKSSKTSCSITASQTNSRARPGKSKKKKPASVSWRNILCHTSGTECFASTRLPLQCQSTQNLVQIAQRGSEQRDNRHHSSLLYQFIIPKRAENSIDTITMSSTPPSPQNCQNATRELTYQRVSNIRNCKYVSNSQIKECVADRQNQNTSPNKKIAVYTTLSMLTSLHFC